MEFIEWFLDDHLFEYIGAYMFLALACALFTGLPVAFALGGISLIFGLIAISIEALDFAVFFQVINRDDPLLSCMRGLNTSQAVEVTFAP